MNECSCEKIDIVWKFKKSEEIEGRIRPHGELKLEISCQDCGRLFRVPGTPNNIVHLEMISEPDGSEGFVKGTTYLGQPGRSIAQ